MQPLRSKSVLLACVLLANCGTQTPANLKDATKNTKPILVVLGGNGSCDEDSTPRGMGLYAPFKQVLGKLENHYGGQVPYLVSCYNSGASRLHYVTSQSDDVILQGSQEDLTDALTLLVTSTENAGLLIAGHSYGGWLALQTALVFKDAAKLSGVFSIDPISRIECTFANPQNCTSAPKDITPEQYASLGASAAQWINFYQTQTFYLHSSPIVAASQNIKVPTSHTSIDAHASVWSKVNEVVDLGQML